MSDTNLNTPGWTSEDPMHTCDGCDGTITCSQNDLRAAGWIKHRGATWTLTLCETCDPKENPG